MERNLPKLDWYAEKKKFLIDVFGEGAITLLKQIVHDNESLSNEEAIEYAWQLVQDIPAFEPADNPKARTAAAIYAHQAYESFRRTLG